MYAQPRQERFGAAAAALGVTAALGWALLIGLGGEAIRHRVDEGLRLFDLAPPPPPPPRPKTVQRPKVSKRAEGRAAPPNIRSKATQVVAPTPVVVIPVPPPPIVVATKAFEGKQTTQGAAPRIGPGTGAGGVGDGTGLGGWGDGDGDGGDETPPIQRRGRITDGDFPSDIRDLAETGFEGTVSVRFLVQTNGRVGECRITRSSGYRSLDDQTCRLIQQRFRFEPSRDAGGRPVPAWILENHTWAIEGDRR